MNSRLYQNLPPASMVVANPAALRRFGVAWLKTDHIPHVWLLRGPLGAGKTTLVQGLARSLGIRRPITSPTFGLVKTYSLRRGPWKRLMHIDAYRLRRPEEVPALELAAALCDSATLVVIEWPERIRGLAWGPRLIITLAHHKTSRRVRARIIRR